MLWVHLTLLNHFRSTYELLVGPLSASERDVYCAEAAAMAIALCAREAEVPRTWTEVQRSIERVRESGALTVSEQARTLARSVLYPAGGWALFPATFVNRVITVGLLPAE